VQGHLPVRADALERGDTPRSDQFARKQAQGAEKQRLRRQRRLLKGPKPAKTKAAKNRSARTAFVKARMNVKQLKNWTAADDDEEEATTMKERAWRAARNPAKANGAKIEDDDTGSTDAADA
jgi:ribosomal protein S8E